MEYLLFLVIPLMSLFKGLGQSYVSKNRVKTLKDNLFLNLLMFAVAASLFAVIYIRGVPNTTVIFYALGFALTQVIFQITYTLAFKYGSYAITATLISFAIVVQILFCLLFFGEKINTYNYIAFLPLAGSIVSFSLRNKDEVDENKDKNRTKWLIFTIITLICNIVLVVVPIFFKHESEPVASLSGELYAYSFIFAFFMMLPIFGISCLKIKEPVFKLDTKVSAAIIIAGVALVFYNYLSTICLNYFPGAIIYPIRNALIIVMNFIAEIFFYKNKLTIPQWIGAGLAIVAVVLLNL